MRITHLSTWDLRGGAARSAYRLHTGLRSLGHDSRLLVSAKQSADPSVIPFERAFDIRTRLYRALKRFIIQRTHLASRPMEAGFFSDDRSQHGGEMLRQALPSDIIHLHWVAEFVDYTNFFSRLPNGLPVAWTLHDMNPFTGGCHHAGDCSNFTDRCGCCPQLGSSTPRDLSRAIWRRKHLAYKRLAYPHSCCIVTPSQWLADKARQSTLMRAIPIHVIPYGLDVNALQPLERTGSRASLGLPFDAKVLLFVSQLLYDGNKGLPILLEALERITTIPNLYLLAVGQGQLPAELPFQAIALGALTNERLLQLAYTAADLLILPSVQENFPNTALEALSCGLPVVGSRVGGIPEIVRPGQTGLLAEPSHPGALAKAIEELLKADDRRRQMSADCRRIAVNEFSLEIQARRYVRLYQEMLEGISLRPSPENEK